MMQRSIRGTRAMTLAALAFVLPALHACYEYRPLMTQTPPVGESIALQITDRGRVDLAERFGSGLAEIQGRLVSNQENEYVVNVFRVSQLNGESAAWSGEASRIDRAFVGTVKGRVLSPLRTTLFSAAAGAGLYFLLSRTLSGSFSGGEDNEPAPPPPASIRIPFGFRF